MSFSSVGDIINFAIEKEKEAVSFYQDLSKLETASGAKETFHKFSKEEEKHVTMLENFLKNKKLAEEYQFKNITDLKISDYLVDVKYDQNMSYPDRLRLAMKREEKSLAMYREISSKAKDNEQLKIFNILAQEEANHKQIIETIYDDYMAEQGN
ncbi:MAG: ferritin family protein [Proteobacteria bacterium]|nr:ferritin family protein [Pseudomonadota bacterium]